MKSLVIYWLIQFTIIVAGGALLAGSVEEAPLRFGAFVATIMAPAFWLRQNWAPEFYRKRQERKKLGVHP